VGDSACTPPSYTDSNTRETYYGDPVYDDFPVIWVNWNQAEEYCTWGGKRVPTEAEWEYAARGGLSGKRYAWGDTDPTCGQANFYGCLGDTDAVCASASRENGYELCDMAGNVWEWVEDEYHISYAGAPNDGTAWLDSPIGWIRVVRGGSWDISPLFLRLANRGNLDGSLVRKIIGFRCAR